MSAARPGEGEGDRETQHVIRQSETTGTQSAHASLQTQSFTRSGFNPLHSRSALGCNATCGHSRCRYRHKTYTA